jgi:hypothetical protein
VQAAAWVLAALAVLMLVALLVLLGLNSSRIGTSKTDAAAILALAVVVCAGTGRLITSRVPGNAIGWLLGLIGLTVVSSLLAEQYAVYGVATAPGSLPAAKLVGSAAGGAAGLTVILLLLLVLLFPDGRLPSRRWRPVLWASFVVAAGWMAQGLQVGTQINGGLTNAIAGAKASYSNPVGFIPRYGFFSGLFAAIFALGVVTGVLVVASVFARRRGAGIERRKQLAWLGYIGLMTAIWAAALALASVIVPGPANSWLGTVIWAFLTLTPVLGIPLACAVAVLRYRLYEIDRIISRTLAYAIVTGLLLGVYAGLVLLATEVLRFHSSVAVAASTLVAAALFTPVRNRVQRLVDRRFNRTRYDADLTVTAFAAQLKDAVDHDAVRADLLGVVQRSLEPTHLALWVEVSPLPSGVAAAVYPEGRGRVSA